MNKKLLTLAVGAALAAPAMMAQADVKVYGAAQVEITRIKNDSPNDYPGTQSNLNNSPVAAGDEKTATLDNKRGRFGISADEDLGGGMKGLAKFEWNVDTSDGTDGPGGSALAARDAWVGIKGPFGTVRLGRSGSPYKQTGVALDPFVTTSMEARNNFGMSGNADGYGILTAHNSFLSEGLHYGSPSFVGITIDLYVGLDGTGANAANTAAGIGGQGGQTNGDVSAAISWKGGPVNVFAAYNKANNVGNTAINPPGPEPTAMKIGGQFKLAKMHTISVQFEQTDRDNVAADDSDEGQYLFLGYQLKLGNTTIVAQGGLFENGGGSATPANNQEATYMVLGAIYNFSKTFRVFGGYRATELENDVVGVNTVRDDQVLTVGMRKDF